MTSVNLAGVVRERADGCSLAIRVQPGAKRTAILGVYDDGSQPQLKIALKAPPIDGRANDALVAYLAGVFALPRSAVSIAHGIAGRSKLVTLSGVPAAQVMGLLEALL